MPPVVVDVMNEYRRALLHQEQQQMLAMAQRWRMVEDSLSLLIENVAGDLANESAAGRTVSLWKVRSLDRYQTLLAQVRVQMATHNRETTVQIAIEQRTLARLGIEQAGELIRAASRMPIGFDVLPVEAIENMVGLAGNGSPLQQLLAAEGGAVEQRMTEELVRSTALGRNPRETAARAIANGLRMGLQRSLVIARTEQLRVYREASRQAYIHSGVVKGFRRLATKDSRTCMACLMADGEVYELTETLREHPQGRCAMIPMVIGMPVLSWRTGADWFRAQSAATQRTMMGPQRYEAWRRGAFDLDQLVSVRRNATWGDSVAVTPLAQLDPALRSG